MKRFKSFFTEGEVIPFPGKEPKAPPENFVKTYIQKAKDKINSISPHIDGIINEPLNKDIVKDMTPTITNQYKGTDVHPIEQLHQFITYPVEDLHPDTNVGSRMKEFAINVAKKHKAAILDHLNDKIDRSTEIVRKHAGDEEPILKHFHGTSGSIGHLKEIKSFFERI